MEPRGLSSRLTMLLYPLTRRSPDHALGSPVAAVLGLLVESVGVLALGLVTMAVGELAWWCGVALMVWGWTLVFLLLLPMMGVLAPPLSGILGRGISRVKLDRGGLWSVPSGERTDRAASKRALRRRTSQNSVKAKFAESPFRALW